MHEPLLLPRVTHEETESFADMTLTEARTEYRHTGIYTLRRWIINITITWCLPQLQKQDSG